ncbi:MAG: N-acetylneuraminate synthase family protein [Alphaproteobacteria bacterium]|nr:N-acetylneuraminate synthase family protein [Alphaproteobacteria bacterium]
MIGGSAPCYIIAEISCNHEGDFSEARKIIEAAAKAGADAVKIQTYKAETMTRDFKTRPKGTMWENLDLYKLYEKAHTPWEWHSDLAKIAADLGMHMFSTPFDETSVDHLVEMDVPVLKLASFEVVDTKLIEKIAKTGLPVIMSNGMTDFLEMNEAIETLRAHGTKDLAITHCNSGYPAAFDEVNLATMAAIEGIFDVVVGLSDHTIYADDKTFGRPMAHVTPLEAVRFGAKIIEVHLMMDREKARALHAANEGGFDWPFSREPQELEKMIRMIREYERTGQIAYDTQEEAQAALRTHGRVCFDPTEKEISSRTLRPSLWAVSDIKAGEALRFAAEDKSGNFDSIRPAGGMHIRHTDFIAGKRARRDIQAGEPLNWDMVDLSAAKKDTHG